MSNTLVLNFNSQFEPKCLVNKAIKFIKELKAF